jgi:L-ascorbate metabolism protein UlaG (beta-lactamase superfamily)
MSLKIAGKLPSGKHKERLKQSPYYKMNGFENLSATPMIAEGGSYWKMIRDFFSKNKNAKPSIKLPFVKTDLTTIPSGKPAIVWFGHSSYLLRFEEKNFLIDPVFSGNAAPVSFMVKAFPGSNEYKAGDMPPVDYLVLTHDHYDHLDFKTILKLKKKIKQIICSLGVSSHLRYWGFDPAIITELDWWEEKQLDNNIQIIATPARHFSGRGLKRGQTFWSSFIVRSTQHSIYLGGDSGYDTHFKAIGEKYGPFDLAILESGQYNVMWPLIHMMPEETVQAAVDLKAKTLLPVHWGKFSLAMHDWNEPIKRVLQRAKELKMEVLTPSIGEMLQIGVENKTNQWWNL